MPSNFEVSVGKRGAQYTAQAVAAPTATAALSAGASAIGIGASVGSVVPIIGTAIGALVGAIAGSLVGSGGEAHGRGTVSRAKNEAAFATKKAKLSADANRAGLAAYVRKYSSDKGLAKGKICTKASDPASCRDLANLWAGVIEKQSGDVAPRTVGGDVVTIQAEQPAVSTQPFTLDSNSPSNLPSWLPGSSSSSGPASSTSSAGVFSRVADVLGALAPAAVSVYSASQANKTAKQVAEAQTAQARAAQAIAQTTQRDALEPGRSQPGLDLGGFLSAILQGGGARTE